MSLTLATVTGWSGFWQMEGDMRLYAMQTSQNRAQSANVIAKYMNKRSVGDARAALAALIGAAAGETATQTFTQVGNPAANSGTVPTPPTIGEMGGVRPVSTITQINRATTAADVAELKKWFSNALLESSITYPTAVGLTQGGNQVGGTGRF
jgi:hypothetical protein